ncbi:MAG: hypothetical protein IKO46_05980 [Salinivirgaceae bacterium]|nr:hypothetical protein [Salinivirgaceae bacterium]
MCKFKETIWCPIFVSVSIPLLVVVFTCVANIWLDCEIRCSDTILALIGILATFVVIGNHIQVSKMESKIRQYQNENEEKISNCKNEIEELKKKIEGGDIAELNLKIDVILSAINSFSQSEKNENNPNINIECFKNIYQKISDRKTEIINRRLNNK